MISRDFNKLKRLAYEYESMGQKESQGEAILDFLRMPKDATVRIRQLLGVEQLNKINKKLMKLSEAELSDFHCIKDTLDYISMDNEVPLAGLIEAVLPCTTP